MEMAQKYQAPVGCPGVSLLGEFYETDANGMVVIPAGIANDLESHGFVPVAEVPAKLSDRRAPEVIAALPQLADDALVNLLAEEQAGSARKTVLAAIENEMAKRAAAVAPVDPAALADAGSAA
ncbi:MAG: hypothetical protein AB1400_08860 [Pseudomonadota bacterium]|jgi:hypothetical protein